MYQQKAFNRCQAVTCQLYARNTKIVGANSLRYHMFCTRRANRIWTIAAFWKTPDEHDVGANNYRRLSGASSLETCQTSQHHQRTGLGTRLMAVRSKSDGWRVYQLQMSSLNLISWQFMQKDGSTVRLLLHLEWVKCTVVCKLQGCSNMVAG
ncbi:hypothetical protein GWK47_042293 [Chionoecetes opilio]|uniref:Uncharacterized protein n=1 Tax=Chionoecetes opilio TaxID=41210 RepID=A0A8J4YAK9_CHIOP|nr:hypothetical protein GWK47_042293 [Chionoecetes opilio]